MDGDSRVTRPHRFTVADYYRMAEAGIFNEDSRVELIRGQIVDLPPIGAPHFAAVNRLNRLLVQAVDDRAIVSVQNPVRLDDGSEPEPDIALLRPRADDYATAIAGADDVLLIVEIADSSLRDDRAVKAPLYAEGGIPEYWIVNLVERVVEVHRQPAGGRYVQTRRVRPDEMLPILGLGDSVAIPASAILREPGEPERSAGAC